MASRSCAGRPKPPGAVLCAVGRDGGAVKGGRASEPSADAICLPWQNAQGSAVDARSAGSALKAAPGCRPERNPSGAVSETFGAPPLAAAAAPPPVDWRASPAFSARERGEDPRACSMSVIAPRGMDQAALRLMNGRSGFDRRWVSANAANSLTVATPARSSVNQ